MNKFSKFRNGLPSDMLWEIKGFVKAVFNDNDALRETVEKYVNGTLHERQEIINTYGKINDWDVSRITSMNSLFCGTRVGDFNEDIRNWNVSNVKDFEGMFFQQHTFNQPLNNWDVSNAETMNGMFSLTDYNKPLVDWKPRADCDYENMWFHVVRDLENDTPFIPETDYKLSRYVY